MASTLTPKAQQTREHILETALALFASKGYQETTLRDIAAQADISLGLTYRYFARKEELIVALYERLTAQTEEAVAQLPALPLAARFGRALRDCLARLAPHRDALGALFGAGLDPNSPVAVLGEGIGPIRARVWSTYLAVANGASDAPRPRQAPHLATVFYALHLTVILFWLQDRSPGQRLTHELLDFGQQMLGRLRPALGLPPVARALARLARILGPLFGPPAPNPGETA
ncbi:MAG: TetR/AcrR family transcriptional regulator [Armatimonadetes bacterium]|nr:TetR/AcrR family transcriptional regulator [Armatimonadota bacterium]